jgi:membrane fusion protein (multidrug efflux system)
MISTRGKRCLLTMISIFFLFSESYALPQKIEKINKGSSTTKQQILETPTSVYSENIIILSSQIEGVIQKLNVKEGSYFKKGEELLMFDCTQYNSDLQKAKAIVIHSFEKYTANKKLYALGGANKVDMTEAYAQHLQGIAELERAKHLAAQCKIYAPFSGQVIELAARQHESIEKGQKLIKLLDNKNLIARLFIPSDWLQWISKKTKFTIKISETNKTYKARISRIIYHIDSVSKSVKVIATIEDPNNQLHSGMSGIARFLMPKKIKKSLQWKTKNPKI